MTDKRNKLHDIQKDFFVKLGLTPIIGVELEFYLSKNIEISKLSRHINYVIKTEKGNNQFEIEFAPDKDLNRLADLIKDTRYKISQYCIDNNGFADFSSKPFINDFGNSMHIHLNFLEDDNIEKYINILCFKIKSYITYCLPEKSDYTRLDHKFMAPTHISWGGNNRSVMIRIPDSLPKRLEHRLPSASCDPSLVICSLLQTIQKTIESGLIIKEFPKIYGNSYAKQYGCELISSI